MVEERDLEWRERKKKKIFATNVKCPNFYPGKLFLGRREKGTEHGSKARWMYLNYDSLCAAILECASMSL